MTGTGTRSAPLALALVVLGLLAGESQGAIVLHDPFRYFQHQSGINPDDDAFKGVCFSAAGYNTMLGIVDAGYGTWKALSGGTEAYGNSIAGKYDFAASQGWYGDGDQVNQVSTWFLPNENFIATYLRAPEGYAYRTQDYAFADLGSIDQAHAIGAMALIDRIDSPDAKTPGEEWWLNYHVVSLYELDIEGMTARFTDSNIDRAGKEYTNKPGASLRGDFTYGLLEGGGQGLSWNASGITQNADGTNMDDEQLASIRVIYMVQLSEPSTILLVGLAGVLAVFRRAQRAKPIDSAVMA